MKIQTIPQDLIFDLPQVSGGWYSAFQTACMYLMAPDELFKMYNEDKNSYKTILEPIIVLFRDSAEQIKEKNLLVEKEINLDTISKDLNPPSQQPEDSKS